MLSNTIKTRVKSRKVLKHSNPSQFLDRVRRQSLQAIKDLTLLAEYLEEEQLQEIFNKQNLEKLFVAIMEPPWTHGNKKPSKDELDRIFDLGFMFVDTSVPIIEHTLGNVYAQRLYARDRDQFIKTLKGMYFDKKAHRL